MELQMERALVEHCAPTLARVKPGSLFCVRGAQESQLRCEIGRWDGLLSAFGVRVCLLRRENEKRAWMVYVYRPDWIGRILQDEENRKFLVQNGYGCADLDGALNRLAERAQQEEAGEFPHEIGLFLGYPLQDVVGFIENRGRNFTCCGCWKSYGDPAQAQRQFRRYHACTRAYKRLYRAGTPVTRLVIAA